VVEIVHTERDRGPAHAPGVRIPVVDDDPRVLTDLPQILLTDDLVRRTPEEHPEPFQCPAPVAHAHDAVQIHPGSLLTVARKVDHSADRNSSDGKVRTGTAGAMRRSRPGGRLAADSVLCW